MQVIVADKEGLMVSGYLTLATKVLDDSRAPHTLEHLIFIGSRTYKYNCLLNKLAGRAYSTGWNGFAQILPVYLEYIILPNITDNAYITEVYYVNGERNNAGMNVGFRYKTGGIMEALRILDKFKESIINNIALLNKAFKRYPPILKETVVETVEFPKEDKSIGILLSYLCGFSVSTIKNIMPINIAIEKLDFMYKCLIFLFKDMVRFEAKDYEYFYSSNIITDYLFGSRDGSILADLLKAWLSDAYHVTILGKPLMKLATKLKKTEEARVAKRKEDLGKEGLKKLKQRLDKAKKHNDLPIPAEVLDKWQVPSPKSIHFIEPQGKPLFLQFENVSTNFVHITVHVGTSETNVKYRPLMPLFTDNFFNTPVYRDGNRVEFEDVVKQLEKDTISYQISGAGRVGDDEGMMIHIEVEREKYETMIGWLCTLMFDSIFNPVRIKTAVVKALADVPEAKRDGRAMALEVDMVIHTVKESFPVAKCTLVKAVYLRRLKKLLENDPDTAVGWFKELSRSLFTFQNLRVLVTADIAKLPNPVAAWGALSTAPSFDATKEMLPIVPPYTMLNDEGRTPGSYGAVIIPMTTLDSSYSVSTASGLQSYADPRFPAYLVALGYLQTAGGPLWNAVRGNGLAYVVSFSREIEGGYIQYRVYRSTDASKAIDASRITGAISGIVREVADRQATMAAAAQQNFIESVVRGLEQGWNRKILERVLDVTEDEIRAVLTELVLPVFEPGKSNVVVTCAPLMQENMEKMLGTMGYKTQVQRLSHFYDDYGLKGDNEEDDEEDDEDDEDDDDDMSEEGHAMMDGAEDGSDFDYELED
ncbi:hypothetical protein F5883DRAFT_660986 [Diaporthe sp. PMI_573]|nr:hypothetical protein F5883DRAFT_660986 [Diaporthaceae sp. PMI_573]